MVLLAGLGRYYQNTEAEIGCAILNQMTSFGVPVSVRIKFLGGSCGWVQGYIALHVWC
jgi:hypothetical protein